jgi:hypothetical protein
LEERGFFQEGDGVALLAEGDGGGESGDACAYDDDLERSHGFWLCGGCWMMVKLIPSHGTLVAYIGYLNKSSLLRMWE